VSAPKSLDGEKKRFGIFARKSPEQIKTEKALNEALNGNDTDAMISATKELNRQKRIDQVAREKLKRASNEKKRDLSKKFDAIEEERQALQKAKANGDKTIKDPASGKDVPIDFAIKKNQNEYKALRKSCLLYTSDAADDM
jgi:hypothetical protein